MDVTEALALVLRLLLRFEGLLLHPYLCPAGVPTIGLGSTHYLDGTPVRLADPPITREHALLLARAQVLRVYMPAARRLCPTADTPGRLAALTDFPYNVGVAALRSSTLRRRALAGDWEGVRRELAKWVRGGGRVLPGLVRRRAAEADLI